MTTVVKVTLLGCSAAALGVSIAVAQSGYSTVYVFDIPSKPLLAALADFTAETGVQVIRPGSEKLAGRSRAVRGRKDAGTALRTLLEGSGLTFRPVGPRTVTLARPADLTPAQTPHDGAPLEPIDVIGRHTKRSGGGDGGSDVTAAEMERKQPADIRDVFAGEPGVQVGGSIPLNQKVYVRGVEENNLAVSIDGAPQNNKVFHHAATTVIDPALLKTARVDAGVAPADAGFGALAGSIAYQTKDVADMLGRDTPAPGLIAPDGPAPGEPKNWGGFSRSWFNANGSVFGQNMALYGRREGFEALSVLNVARGRSYRSGRGDREPGSATHLTSGLAKLAHESGSGDRFEFSHEQVIDDADRPFRANASLIVPPNRIGEPRVRRYDLERRNTVLTYRDATPEGWWDPRVVLSYGKTRLKTPLYERIGVLPGPIFVFSETRGGMGETSTYGAKAENTFRFDRGTVVAGVDLRRDKAAIDYDPVGFDLPGDERSTVAGVFAQARFEPADRARVSFGGRGDHQWFRGVNDDPGARKSHGGLSGNVSGEYDILPDVLTAKAGYSHVWAGVPLAENFVFNHLWTYRGLGERLQATTSDNVTAGLVARHGGFTVEGSLFETRIRNARNAKYANAHAAPFSGVTPGAIWAPDLETRGFDVGVGYDWEAGFVRAKYVRIKIDINGRAGDSDVGTYIATPVGDIIALSAAHTFAPWRVTVGGDIEIAPKYRRAGRDSVTFETHRAYPAYQIFNAFLEWRPQSARVETTLRVDVKNVFDETYSSRASYGSEFENVTPLFEPGRSVILSAAVRF